MDDFQLLAQRFSRGNTLETAAQVPPSAQGVVESRFVVWFLELAIDYLQFERSRLLARNVQALHGEVAAGRRPDQKSWKKIGASGQFGQTLWPECWTARAGRPVMLTCAIAACRAIYRGVHDDLNANRYRSAYFERLLPSPVVTTGNLAGLGPSIFSIQRLFVRRLAFECILHRTPSCTDEATLQAESRLGNTGPYLDWLTEAGDDDALLHLRKWLECE